MNKVNLSGLTIDELMEVNQQAIRMIKMLRAKQARAFEIGDRVSFYNTRYSREMTGHIIKIGKLNVTVNVEGQLGGGRWRVPAEVLTILDTAEMFISFKSE
jgi:FKBP-type peptidyl-prolyl cis-trans isomerase 2